MTVISVICQDRSYIYCIKRFFCYCWLAHYFADNTKLESEVDILACTTSIQRGLDKLGASQQKPWEVQQGERASFVCGAENPHALLQAGNWLADKPPCWKGPGGYMNIKLNVSSP